MLGDAVAEDWRLYTPVLRAKASEWDALAQLSPGVRRRVVPVIEFIPHWTAPGASTTTRKRRAPQTPDEYVDRFLTSLELATPPGTTALVYFGHAGQAARWNSIDLWDRFGRRTASANQIVPLVDLASAPNSPSLALITRARGRVGLRLKAADLGPSLASRIARELQILGVQPGMAHVIVDLQDQPAAVSHDEVRVALGRPASFAAITILSGVFPQDLTRYQQGVATEPRTEWRTWWQQHVGANTGDRLLGFGDYTTQCAHYQPAPEVPGSVSLRYTTDDAILVFRGRQSNNASGLGHNQMHGHCRLLVARADYDGAAFSAGDQRFNCWTSPANGTGNASQWRTASIVHHITHVVAQLQDPIGSTASFRGWARTQAPAPCR